MNGRSTLWATLLLGLAACGSVPRDALTSCQQVAFAAKTDVLFVIDDSGSMAGHQDSLGQGFQAFINRLAASPVKNDYQIAVTTTSVDLYTGTMPVPDTFVANSACSSPPYPAGTVYPKGALVSVTGTLTGNLATDAQNRVQSTTSPPRILPASSPTLVTDFTSNAFVGVCGSGKEQGLEAARLAIQKAVPGGPNEGFLRPGARLAVIIVSDDDDCSDPLHQGTSPEPTACTSYDVNNYVGFFQSPIAGEDRHVVIGAIVAADATGAVDTACAEDPNHGPTRYKAFVSAFGGNGIRGDVCDASFDTTLGNIADLVAQNAQTLLLSGAPADWRLLAVTLQKASGATITCRVGTGGSVDVVYADSPPRLDFGQSGGACTLEQGDQVSVKVICAG